MIVRRWGNEEKKDEQEERDTLCAVIRSVWVHKQYKQYSGSGSTAL